MAEEDRREAASPDEEPVAVIARVDKEDFDEESRDRMGGFRHNHTAEPLRPRSKPADSKKSERRD